MRVVMELALNDAGISPQAVGYVNGHGTARSMGDIAETRWQRLQCSARACR